MSIHEKAATGFNRVADAYERGRPDYPSEALTFFVDHFNLHNICITTVRF